LFPGANRASLSRQFGVVQVSTRQRRNKPWARAVLPAICAALIGYFAYHTFNGRFGIYSLNEAREEAVRLEFALARITAEREALEARVRLLRDGTIERDMLDEQARATLNLVNENEIVIQAPSLTQD
jgi:cell division protein FtsB